MRTYWGDLAGSCFSVDSTGRRLFHRFGIFCPPYVLPDAEVECRLRRVCSSFYRRLALGTILLLPLLPVLPIYWLAITGVFLRRTSALLRSLPRTQERLTVAQSLRTRANAYDLWLLRLGAGASAVVFLWTLYACVWMAPLLRPVYAMGALVTILPLAATVALLAFKPRDPERV